MDYTDKKILKLLQEDAKLTTKELAAELELSLTPTFERLKKLNKAGYIKKYVALLDNELLDRGFIGFCFVTLKEHSEQHIKGFTKDIVGLDEVMECHHIAGQFDYLLKINTADIKAYQAVLVQKLSKINSVGKVESAFSMSVIKNETAIKF